MKNSNRAKPDGAWPKLLTSLFHSVRNYLLLPAEITEFEAQYLAKMNRIATSFFALHMPVIIAIAYFNQTNPWLATMLSAAGMSGPLLALRCLKCKRAVSCVQGFTMVYMCGLLVHFAQGPVQIEMHFYFFIGLAILSIFGNPLVIIVAAAALAIHHVGLYWVLPSSAFNYEVSPLVLSVHILYAVLGAISSVFMARTFFDNIIGLEKIVDARTAEVEERNQDMRMILNSVEEGFLTIDKKGRIHNERSAAAETLIGPLLPDDTLAIVMARHEEKVADWFELALLEVFDGPLPIDVTLDQLPKSLIAHGRHLSLKYCPVEHDGKITHLTVVVADVTAEVERQKIESESRELLAMFQRITRDRNGFLEFFREASEVMDALRNEPREDLVLLKRRLHTLKGNASVFGLTRIAEACHALEDEISQTESVPAGVLWTELFGRWASARGRLRRLVSEEANEYRLSNEQYNEVLLGLLNREPPEILAPKVAAWKLDPTEYRLRRISNQAQEIAKRLGKGEIEIQVEANGLRTESDNWKRFWGNLIHVIRNAVDHGLESVEERQMARKKGPGRLLLTTTCADGRFMVTISDNGRGIDWDLVTKAAEAMDLPTAKHEDLVEALFADGLSTTTAVSETSGRGIGMGALRQECEELKGTIEVHSQLGQGTEFRFVFPVSSMAPDVFKLLSTHGIDADLESIVAA